MSDTRRVTPDDDDKELDEYYDDEEDDSLSKDDNRPGPWTFIIAAILFIAVLTVWLWNALRQAKAIQYRAPIVPLPGAPAKAGDDGKYVLQERIAFRKGYQWGPVPPGELKNAAPAIISMVGLASPALSAISLDSNSLRAYAESAAISMSASFKIGSNTNTMNVAAQDDTTIPKNDTSKDPQPTQQEIDDFIHSRLPINPQDLAEARCGSRTDYLFFQATRLPNNDQTIIKPENGNGYCIMTCSAARVSKNPGNGLPSDVSFKFDNAKNSDGSYRVNYELALWIDPRQNEAGYTWYCRAIPNLKMDGVGWSPTVDGMYQRRLISPIYYTTQRDPFMGNYGSGNDQNDDWKLCSNSYLPIPPPSELGGSSYTASSDRWHGQVFRTNSGGLADRGKPWPIGYNKTNYTLVDFQMIGRYCYWVGHDDYDVGDEDSSKADATWHGNFSKVKLANLCPQQQQGVDGLKYDMKLTPSKLSCYYCPRIYEWDDEAKALESYETYLRGSEVDGYICVRSCPRGMTDEQSGNLHWCIPIGISMPAIMPNVPLSNQE